MKLPWDREYLKISFHVIVTVLVLGSAMLIMSSLPQFSNVLFSFLAKAISLLAPLIIAIVVAFLLNPIVEFLQHKVTRKNIKKQKFIKRTKGTTITYVLIFLLVGFSISLGVRKLGASDINQFAFSVNTYIQDLSDMLLSLQRKLSHMGVLGALNNIINSIIVSVTHWAKNTVMAIAGGITTVGGATLNIAIGFVVAFYFLVEKDRMIYKMKEITNIFFPKKISMLIITFCHDVNTVFSGYVTGQVTDAIIMAGLIIVSFWAAGIKYAVLIGIISGFSNLIPYVGAVVAFVLSVMVGLVSGTPIKAVYAAIIVIILQQIDSMIIVPKIVGKSVKLHPVLVILALSGFGGMFGIWGMVVAVPVTALIKIYFDRVLARLEGKKLEN